MGKCFLLAGGEHKNVEGAHVAAALVAGCGAADWATAMGDAKGRGVRL